MSGIAQVVAAFAALALAGAQAAPTGRIAFTADLALTARTADLAQIAPPARASEVARPGTPSPEPLREGPLRLALPIACTLGVDCYIQNYVDRDAGPGWRDFACGHLSYDGHLGTDFRVPSLADMERGVEVLAAADGVVAATRDGEPDVHVSERGRDRLRGRDAGNSVRIEHGGGWETQYSHLRLGTVRVTPGQRVTAGQTLGLVGLSGNTEFPHLDFVVRHRARAIDPFAPQVAAAPTALSSENASCPEGPIATTLWRPDLIETLRYRPTGVLIAGFAAEAPDRRKAQRGEYRTPIGRDAPAMVFWVEVFGSRAGDVETWELHGPDGAPIARREKTVDRNYAVRFAFVGRSRAADAWAPGEYRAIYTKRRAGDVVAHRETTLRID